MQEGLFIEKCIFFMRLYFSALCDYATAQERTEKKFLNVVLKSYSKSLTFLITPYNYIVVYKLSKYLQITYFISMTKKWHEK